MTDETHGLQATLHAKPRAVAYVRMSTEHQQYSTENQLDRIKEYALKRGVELVQTFTDAGKSGLRIDGRIGLQKLLSIVQSGQADFSMILAYDVSRWGRFQDADESAYYEYICRKAGIQVAYCAEQFENDGSPISTIVKGVKRAMAGEYSRELSAKVFAGQCRLVELGFRQGGLAGYGFRRMLLDQAGQEKGQLSIGQMKSLQTDRVVLVSGPDDEVAVIKEIYDMFIDKSMSEHSIAEFLNSSGRRTQLGRKWSRGTVHEVLTNEKYIGSNVYNRVSFKLKKARIENDPEMWIRRPEALPALVPSARFYLAQGIIRARSRRLTDADLIEHLKALYERRGYLSGLVIDEAEGMPSSTVYANRFGSLLRAYHAVGFLPSRNYAYIEINRVLRRMHPNVVQEVEAGMSAGGSNLMQDPSSDLISVNGEFTTSITLARSRRTSTGALRWRLRFDTGLRPDVTVAVRMNEANSAARDYYLFPRAVMEPGNVNLAEQNAIELESFRLDSLDYFYKLAARTRWRKVA